MRIARADFPALFRNAALNTLQGYTIGYLVGQPYTVHLVMAAAGLAFLVLMLVSGQWVLAALILLTSATFVPYYPPIPAYMYGAYALLVVALLQAADVLVQRFRPARSIRRR